MRTFFVLAMGRSGTHFLSGLLATDGRGVVHHEPHTLDPVLTRLRQGGGTDRALDAELDRRFDELLGAAAGSAFYGEVNSYLRFEAPYLARRFPDAVLIHLVRNGRDFVRSAWTREPYTGWEREGPFLPRDDDRWSGSWASFDRFRKLCWMWTHANETIARDVARVVRFEDVLRDYAALRDGVLAPTGVQVDESTWRATIGRPTNTSRQYVWRRRLRRALGRREMPSIPPLPPAQAWEPERRAAFREICGDTMRRFGYDV